MQIRSDVFAQSC